MIVASLLMQGRNYREQSPRFFIFKLPDICGAKLATCGISGVDTVIYHLPLMFYGQYLIFYGYFF